MMQAKLSTSVIKTLQPDDKPFEVFDTLIKGFLLRVQPTGRMTFYYSYRNKASKRQRIKIGMLGSSLTVQQARDKALSYANQVASGLDVQAQKANAQKEAIEQRKHTLESFLEDHYEPWQVANYKTGQATINGIRSAFRGILSLPLSEITHPVIDKLRVEKQKAGLTPTTINWHVNMLRGALSRAVEWEIVQEHPFKKIKNFKIDKNPKVRYLSEEESTRLLAALEERDEELKQARERGNEHRQVRGYELMPSLLNVTYADRMTPMVIMALKTGMRQGELFELRWRDVDFDTPQVTAHGGTTKSSNTRHIPLSPMALDVLTAWKEQETQSQPDDRVFPSDSGGRLDNVKKSWASILKRANITNFRWHDQRHDFASQLVMKGVPLNTVRELCGHASMDTTLRYAHLAPDHKQEAVDLLG